MTTYGKPLSDREHQILVLMARGLVNSAIAEELGTAENTIKTASMRIFVKLGVHTRGAAIAAGCHGGLIPPPDDATPLPHPRPPRGPNAVVRVTQTQIPAGLLAEVATVLRNVALGRHGAAISRQAGVSLNSLRAYTDKTPVPAQRTESTRP